MKNYDYKKAKELIEKSKDCLSSASLGMYEDWWWTADTVWENGEYTKEIPDNYEEIHQEYLKKRKEGMSLLSEEIETFQPILIGGLYGSSWATPTLHLSFIDGEEQMISCYQGESDEIKSNSNMLGCISSEVQTQLPPLKEV